MSHLNIHSYGQGTPIVWLHGWGFDSQIWLDLLPNLLDLPKKLHIFLVDLPGFGASDNMSWETFKTTLLANLPAQFHLIGWSLGGLFATRLATEAPYRVLQLLQITSSPYFLQQPDWAGIAPATLQDFYQRFAAHPDLSRQQFIQAQTLTQDIDKFQQKSPINLSGLEQGLTILKDWDLRAHLAQVTLPVAYLFGRLDRIVPFQVYQQMQQQYPLFDYTLFAKAGHMPFLSHKEAFLDWLLERLC